MESGARDWFWKEVNNKNLNHVRKDLEVHRLQLQHAFWSTYILGKNVSIQSILSWTLADSNHFHDKGFDWFC